MAVRTAKGRSVASQRWLSRQLNDPYVVAAKAQGWRSRAAFKLIELDERFHLIRPGMRVVDLGAAPGGWSQVAVKHGAASVVGVDLLPMDPIGGAVTLVGDFSDVEVQDRLVEMLGGKADLVLSDMAPNTTGHGATDHLRIVALAEEALAFAVDVLAEGGGFVAKVFQGGRSGRCWRRSSGIFRRCGMRSRRLAGRSLPNCMWWLRGFGVGAGLLGEPAGW